MTEAARTLDIVYINRLAAYYLLPSCLSHDAVTGPCFLVPEPFEVGCPHIILELPPGTEGIV